VPPKRLVWKSYCKGVDEGRSTDEAEAEEFDTLEREVEQIDKDLKRLRSLRRFRRLRLSLLM
jgi:hypothetical protein